MFIFSLINHWIDEVQSLHRMLKCKRSSKTGYFPTFFVVAIAVFCAMRYFQYFERQSLNCFNLIFFDNESF